MGIISTLSVDSSQQNSPSTNSKVEKINPNETHEEKMERLFSQKNNRIDFGYNCKVSVRKRLKDGKSASFNNSYFVLAEHEGKKSPMVCGQVNGKNSFGAFTGYKDFICTVGDLVILEEDMPPSKFAEVQKGLCNGKYKTVLGFK